MPEFQPFCNARLKIERANKHINDLNRELNVFLASDFYRFEVKFHPQTRQNHVEFEITKTVPKELGLIVGDAIHNARAALDVAIGQMVFEKTGVFSDYAKFPFRESREALVTACNGGDVKKAGTNVVTLITDRIRPYPGGNDVLVALHELDIRDKHILLLPHVTVGEVRNAYAEDDFHNRFTMTIQADKLGRLNTIIATPTKIQIKDKGQPAATVLFGEGLPLQGQPIVPSLLQFTQAVGQTINLFEAL